MADPPGRAESGGLGDEIGQATSAIAGGADDGLEGSEVVRPAGVAAAASAEFANS